MLLFAAAVKREKKKPRKYSHPLAIQLWRAITRRNNKSLLLHLLTLSHTYKVQSKRLQQLHRANISSGTSTSLPPLPPTLLFEPQTWGLHKRLSQELVLNCQPPKHKLHSVLTGQCPLPSNPQGWIQKCLEERTHSRFPSQQPAMLIHRVVEAATMWVV